MVVSDLSKYRDYDDIKGLFHALFYLSTEAIRKDMMDVNAHIVDALKDVLPHIGNLGFDTSDFSRIIEVIEVAQGMTKEQLENVVNVIEMNDDSDIFSG